MIWLKYASLNCIEKAGSITLRKTREGIKEELGMTVKTINRTIAKLKEVRKKNLTPQGCEIFFVMRSLSSSFVN